MRISTTERQTKERCLRKWDLESWNRQALVPIVNSVALDFGTIWHATQAQWTRNLDVNPLDIYAEVSSAHLIAQVTRYQERIGCNPSKDELRPIIDAINTGKEMLLRYQQHWHTPLPPGFTLIENELTLIQDIPGTEHCTCEPVQIQCEHDCGECIGQPYDNCYQYTEQDIGWKCPCIGFHQLECTFDGVMADANGDLFIIERKTYSRTPNLEELNNNDQFLAYMWALSKKLPNVVGVAYDGALKNTRKPLDESFLRRILLRSEDELLSFEEQLTYQALDMARLNEYPYNHPALYPVVPPVMGCQRWECSKIDLCHAMSKRQHGHVAELLHMFVRSDYKRHLDED